MTAKEKYTELQQQLQEQLQLLQTKLTKHQEEFENDSSNWGRVGDLNHITTQLENINASIR